MRERALVARVAAHPVLASFAAAAALHLLWWWLIANNGGDMAAQDPWAGVARSHPGSAFNLAWYGGEAPDPARADAPAEVLSLVDAEGSALEPTPTGDPDSEEAYQEGCLGATTPSDPDTPESEVWTVLRAPRAGVYRIAAPYKLPPGTACAEEEPGRP